MSDVDVVAIGTGQTGATYRVTADYATDPGELPQTFVIKLPAQDDTVRDRVVIGYRSECAFYASVADRVQVPTPQCYYCEITDDAMDSPCCSPIKRRRCRAIRSPAAVNKKRASPSRALAGLHGPSWCDPVWLDFPGIAFARPDEAGASGIGRGGADERRHHPREARRSNERRRPRNLPHRNGFGGPVAAGRV